MSEIEGIMAPTFNAKQIYDEECENLLKARKKDMTSDLYVLIHNLKEKKDMKEFIDSKVDELESAKVFYSDIKDNKGKFTIFFLVKIIGFLFLTSHIIGTYQLMGIKDSLEEEVIDSIKIFFTGNTTNNTIDFYQKVYSNNTKKLPALSFFFILSFLSGIVSKLISFPIITIIMLILNGIIFYFLYNFEFREGEQLNEKYSTFNLIILILYNIYFSIILGISALLPMNIFSAGYFYYEQNLMKKIKAKRKKNINIINEDDDNNNILDNKKDNLIDDDIKNDAKDKKNVKNISVIQLYSEDNKDKNNTKKDNISDIYVRDSSSFFLEVNDLKDQEKIKEPEKKELEMPKNNGYYISYLLAFLIAMTVRLFSNSEDIITDHKYLYINLIKFHFIPIIVSLFFYIIFSCAFTKKKDNKSEICITQFCGYVLFQEKKERKKSICCGGCRTGFRKFNIVIWKIYCCCKCFFCDCCECNKCCPCCPISDSCKTKDDLTDLNDREKALCICYKVKGKCSWICDYFSNFTVFINLVLLTAMELYNIGFKSLMNEYIADLDYKRKYSNPEANKTLDIIHIVYIVGAFFFYVFNMLFGRICYSILCFQNVEFSGEGFMMGMGIMVIVMFESIITCVFSSVIYYGHAEDYKYYLMAFSISSVEYVKLQILNFIAKGSDQKSDLFGYSSFISIVLTIERTILSLFDYLITDHMNFIFFQFIIGVITGFIGVCFSSCLCCFKSIIKKAAEMQQEEERLNKESEELKKEMAILEMITKYKKEQEEKEKDNSDDEMNINN